MAATLLVSSRIGGSDYFDLPYAGRGVGGMPGGFPSGDACAGRVRGRSLVNGFTNFGDVKGHSLKSTGP
jgi:hypothetical protein